MSKQLNDRSEEWAKMMRENMQWVMDKQIDPEKVSGLPGGLTGDQWMERMFGTSDEDLAEADAAMEQAIVVLKENVRQMFAEREI